MTQEINQTKKKLNKRIVDSTQKEEDRMFDLTLRPKSLSEFIGQEKVKENLKIFIEAAKKRKESLEHVLFHGSPGIGKTTLAHIIARELKVGIKTIAGPALEKPGDLGSILTNLEENDILFIDEMHRMNRVLEEILYPAMEEYCLDVIIGQGPSARTLRLNLPKFTLIGATTRIGMLSSPLRNRFGNTFRLDFYKDEDIKKIILRSAGILKINIEDQAALEIARRSRKTPRVANRLLKRVRDYSQVRADGTITLEIARKALDLLEIDELGLDEIDRKILQTIIVRFQGRPVGIQALSAATSEERDTLEEVYEPYLLQIGFLARTPRGRIATRAAYEHLGIKYPRKLQEEMKF